MDPKLFGRYQIVRKLAGGGMGRVYLAYDPVLNRQVGLKLIDSGSDRDSMDVIAAERRGAILQDQLAKREPSGRVAQIFDIGEREGYFYIAMEYIEGEDLSELLSRGPVEPHRAVGIALDILDVLVKAHTFQTVIEGRTHRGIIHGDIKPRNIRLTTAGQVKVLDFGIAKAVSMTRSITFNQFGSIPYSSPERLQTGDMDARSDTWSVAIVLFEMLMGRSYFRCDESSKLEWLIRNYKVVSPDVAQLPSGLREIAAKALDPDLNRRFPSAVSLQQVLAEWQVHGVNAATLSTDPDATRRTAFNPIAEDEKTRRTPRAGNSPLQGGFPPRNSRWAIGKSVRWAFGGTLATIFLIAVFGTVYEFRIWRQAEALRGQIESGQVAVGDAAKQYRDWSRRSPWQFPLLPARNSLRDRYTAEADRVIADYREASDSTPVYAKDWLRAKTALNSALALVPDDRSIRGKQKLADGHLKLSAADLKTARADFEEARTLLGRSPDPHLGLAQFYMRGGRDLDKAEAELKEAEHNGFRPGRREQAQLARGYRLRGEEWMKQAEKMRDIGQVRDALKHAEADLAHAQELYNSVAPFYNAMQLAERVSGERDSVAKRLALAQTVSRDTSIKDLPVKENP